MTIIVSLLIRLLPHLSRHPSSLSINYESYALLVQRTHYSVHLTYELRLFLHISERPVIVKASIYVRVSNSCWSVQTLLLSPGVQCLLVSGDCPCSLCYTMSTLRCACILGISQLDYYYLCWMITGYSKLKDFWSNDLPPLSEGFLNGPLLWVLWWMARNQDVCTALSHHSNVYRWLWTAHNWGLANFVPCKQLCKCCSATIVRVVNFVFIVVVVIIIIIIIIIGGGGGSSSSSSSQQQQQ